MLSGVPAEAALGQEMNDWFAGVGNVSAEQVQELAEAAAALKATRAAIGQRLSRARNLIRECVTRKLNTAGSHE